MEEVAQATGGLELGHVARHVDAIDTPDFERDVLTDNRVDVGRRQNFLAEIPMMVLLTEDTGHPIGPNIKRPRSGRGPKVRRTSKAPNPSTFNTRSREHGSFSAV